MERQFSKMRSKKYDLLIIGGGITGACVAHDAVLRGLSVALVEMRDFGWATSSATSKLIHGGLRYLKNMEFGLVRESLRERRTLEIIAPHLVYPFPFLIPTYKETSNSRLVIFPGMILYDILSYDKGNMEDPGRKVPHFELLTRNQVLEKEPTTNPTDLTGGAIYYDCQMYSPERLTLSFILSAAKNGAHVANYAKVEQLIIEENEVKGARVKDMLTNETIDIQASITVNVSGPWADFIAGLALNDPKTKVIRSEGIHLITSPMIKSHALVYRTTTGRHFFIIPWRGKSLIGTTDTKYDGSPDEYGVSQENVEAFIEEINDTHTSANLTIEDIDYTYGGLRPIVEEETEVETDVYDKSRKYEIYDHEQEDKLKGFVTVIGGKYTTSRSLADELVNQVFEKLDRPKKDCITDVVPVVGGNIRNWEGILAEAGIRYENLPENVLMNLLHSYGSRYEQVLDLAKENETLGETICEGADAIKAQIVFGARYEMAMSLEDIVNRRTNILLVSKLSKEGILEIAKIFGKEKGWGPEQIESQAEEVWMVYSRKNIRFPKKA